MNQQDMAEGIACIVDEIVTQVGQIVHHMNALQQRIAAARIGGLAMTISSTSHAAFYRVFNSVRESKAFGYNDPALTDAIEMGRAVIVANGGNSSPNAAYAYFAIDFALAAISAEKNLPYLIATEIHYVLEAARWWPRIGAFEGKANEELCRLEVAYHIMDIVVEEMING